MDFLFSEVEGNLLKDVARPAHRYPRSQPSSHGNFPNEKPETIDE